MGGDDHLLRGTRVVVEMLGPLQPAGVAGVHLEPVAVERDEVVHPMELVDLCAELLGQVEVARGQLVLALWPQPIFSCRTRCSRCDAAPPRRSRDRRPRPRGAETPTGALLKVSALPISAADCCRARSASVGM